tara:strand:+ start:60 stop:428 length:369 start_codon:yes stop_codon:yes gene_type:complete
MPLTIEVKAIKAYGKHGVYTQEKKAEQLFLVDVKAILKDTNKATGNIEEDSLEETINYETIVRTVIELVKEESFNLIETLALKIVDSLKNPKLQEILVTVHKPNTILNQSTDDISVTASEEF